VALDPNGQEGRRGQFSAAARPWCLFGAGPRSVLTMFCEYSSLRTYLYGTTVLKNARSWNRGKLRCHYHNYILCKNTQKLWIGHGRYKLGWINILAIIQGKNSGVLIQREENMSENLLIFSPIRMERPILSWSVTGILVSCSSALDRKRHCSGRSILLLLITKQYKHMSLLRHGVHSRKIRNGTRT
jgi:hypothetical protein